MAMVNTYFDFDDYVNPVKTYFDDQFVYDFVADSQKQIDIYVRKDTYELKDNIFRYLPKGNEDDFIKIENVKEKFKKASSKDNAMTLGFYKDSKSNNYERQVFSLLDCFGNIGGLNEVLEIAGGIIVSFFSGKIFLFNILSSLYQVDASNTGTKQSDLSSRVVQQAASSMKNRFRYSYSLFDVAFSYLWPANRLCCCCRRSERSLPGRLALFERGCDKFAKEFDVVEFARTQRKLRMLTHWLMDNSELLLAAYQKANAISLATDSAGSQSDGPAYSRIPKMLASAKSKQAHIVAVNKFFEEYLKERHTDKDVNLLRGVCSDRPPAEVINKASDILLENEANIVASSTQKPTEEIKSYSMSTKESKERILSRPPESEPKLVAPNRSINTAYEQQPKEVISKKPDFNKFPMRDFKQYYKI